ncbi:hypothetical protein TNCV_3749831 [Trichonephila clavipes]|nr:hypothetical protein TNCV_3749831 [Trichonephila clavipes]
MLLPEIFFEKWRISNTMPTGKNGKATLVCHVRLLPRFTTIYHNLGGRQVVPRDLGFACFLLDIFNTGGKKIPTFPALHNKSHSIHRRHTPNDLEAHEVAVEKNDDTEIVCVHSAVCRLPVWGPWRENTSLTSRSPDGVRRHPLSTARRSQHPSGKEAPSSPARLRTRIKRDGLCSAASRDGDVEEEG